MAKCVTCDKELQPMQFGEMIEAMIVYRETFSGTYQDDIPVLMCDDCFETIPISPEEYENGF